MRVEANIGNAIRTVTSKEGTLTISTRTASGALGKPDRHLHVGHVECLEHDPLCATQHCQSPSRSPSCVLKLVVRGDATRKTTNAVWIVTGKAGTLKMKT